MNLVVAFITGTPCMLPAPSKMRSGANSICSPWHTTSKSRFVSNEFAASVRMQHNVSVNTSNTALTTTPRAVTPLEPKTSASSATSEATYALPPPRRHKQSRRIRNDIAAAKKTPAMKTKPKTAQRLVLRRSGMNSAVVLLGDLRDFCGADMMLRREVIGKVSAHIREKGLKDGKRSFRCDETLSHLLKTEGTFLYVQINGLLAKLDDVRLPSAMGPEYVERGERMFKQYMEYCDAMTTAEYVRDSGDKRGLHSKETQRSHMEHKTGMYAVVYIRGTLSEICDGKTQITRPQLIKTVWKYIKENQLQNEKKKRMIVIDDKLRQALNIDRSIDSIDSFQVTGFIAKQYSSIPFG